MVPTGPWQLLKEDNNSKIEWSQSVHYLEVSLYILYTAYCIAYNAPMIWNYIYDAVIRCSQPFLIGWEPLYNELILEAYWKGYGRYRLSKSLV